MQKSYNEHDIEGILSCINRLHIRKGYEYLHTVLVRDKTELLQQKHTLSLFELNGYKRKRRP